MQDPQSLLFLVGAKALKCTVTCDLIKDKVFFIFIKDKVLLFQVAD